MQTLSIEEQGLYFLAKVSVRKTPTNPRNRMIFGNRSILLFQNNFWYYAKLFYCLVIYTQSYCQNTLLVYQFCSLSCKIANRFMMLEKIVKWWKSKSEHCDLMIFFSSVGCFLFCFFYLCKQLTVTYGARVHGSVFQIEFRVLAREFESIETSPGFTQFLGENWVFHRTQFISALFLVKLQHSYLEFHHLTIFSTSWILLKQTN